MNEKDSAKLRAYVHKRSLFLVLSLSTLLLKGFEEPADDGNCYCYQGRYIGAYAERIV